MFSVLQNKSKIKYADKPFPYLIIDDALPADLYYKLNKDFPSCEKILGDSNYKQNMVYRYNAVQSLKDKEISSDWKNFINFHLSYNFLEDFYNVFGGSIEKFYPNSKSKLPNKNNIGIRNIDNSYFQLDCQFVVNTPVEIKSSVLWPHLDAPNKFFAALLYMRTHEDDSTGGNLTINSFDNKPIFIEKTRVLKKGYNLLEEIEYKANRLVMFLNSPFSIHGVTERNPTKHYRRYINIVGQFNFNLWNFDNIFKKN